MLISNCRRKGTATRVGSSTDGHWEDGEAARSPDDDDNDVDDEQDEDVYDNDADDDEIK